MQITPIPVSQIKPYGRNAKEHPEDQIRRIAASIREFGFNQPIVVDRNMVIIAGHGRYEAALLLQLETVPVFVSDMEPEKAAAYRLADNKLNETNWNMPLVIEELKMLDLKGVDFELTGFEKELILDAPAEPATRKVEFNASAGSGEVKIKCPDCGFVFPEGDGEI